jgi:hypothetical protein
MVRVRALGQFAIELDGSTIEPPHGRRARSLLAWLLLHPGVHPRSSVGSCFPTSTTIGCSRGAMRTAQS